MFDLSSGFIYKKNQRLRISKQHLVCIEHFQISFEKKHRVWWFEEILYESLVL